MNETSSALDVAPVWFDLNHRTDYTKLHDGIHYHLFFLLLTQICSTNNWFLWCLDSQCSAHAWILHSQEWNQSTLYFLHQPISYKHCKHCIRWRSAFVTNENRFSAMPFNFAQIEQQHMWNLPHIYTHQYAHSKCSCSHMTFKQYIKANNTLYRPWLSYYYKLIAWHDGKLVIKCPLGLSTNLPRLLGI